MNKLTRTLLSGAALAAAITLTGCKTTQECEECDSGKMCTECSGEAATLSQNETCPFSGEPVNTDAKMVSFNGKEVGFCCDRCADKFAAMSDADKAAALAKH